MWSEKTIIATQRLPKDFGPVVQTFSLLPDSQEQSDSDSRSWRGRISLSETSSGSAWVIRLFGQEMTSRPQPAVLTGKSPRHIKRYHVEILAARLVDDSIKLEVHGDAEHWPKLEGLWTKLWKELQRQGYKEAPALEVTVPATEDRGEATSIGLFPWNVAVLPVGLAEATEFFRHGWDFAVPPFVVLDGRQLKLDNVVMAVPNRHKIFRHESDGRIIVTLNAEAQNPDGRSWDLVSVIPAIEFILESRGARTRVAVVLIERGAGRFLCAVLDKLIQEYPQCERSIARLIEVVMDYCDLRTGKAEVEPIGSETTRIRHGGPEK
jgi:hypothetical protein